MAARWKYRFPVTEAQYKRAQKRKRPNAVIYNLDFGVFKQQIAYALLDDIKSRWPVLTGRSKRAMRTRVSGNAIIVSNRYTYPLYVEEKRGIIRRAVNFQYGRVRSLV